jgi:hypothetical protein
MKTGRVVRRDSVAGRRSRAVAACWRLASSAALAATTACGAGDGEPDVAVETAELTLDPDNNAGSVNEFRSIWAQTPRPDIRQIEAILDPTMCTDVQRAFLTINMDAIGRYHVIANMSGDFAPDWKAWGNRTFNTRPACAMLPDADAGRSKFILVGRSGNLWWSRGNWNATGLPNNPSVETTWDEISSETYQTNGSPAAATSPNSGRVAVVFLGDNDRLYAHIRETDGTWSARRAGPSNLPAEWTATGTPAIAYIGSLSRFLVVIRARHTTGQSRFYYTFLGSTGFVGVPSGSDATLTRLTLKSGAPLISGDPAVDWDTELSTTTLYYLNVAQVSGQEVRQFYQTSGTVGGDLGQRQFNAIRPDNPHPFMGAPSVVGGVIADDGFHQLIARDVFGTIWWAQTVTNTFLDP